MIEWLGAPSGISNWIVIGISISLTYFLIKDMILWISSSLRGES